MTNGKGSRRRPAAVSDEDFAWSWDLAFGSGDLVYHDGDPDLPLGRSVGTPPQVLTKPHRVRCKGCKEVISSGHVHDMVWCSCGAIFVDGGQEYLRYGGDLDMVEVL